MISWWDYIDILGGSFLICYPGNQSDIQGEYIFNGGKGLSKEAGLPSIRLQPTKAGLQALQEKRKDTGDSLGKKKPTRNNKRV